MSCVRQSMQPSKQSDTRTLRHLMMTGVRIAALKEKPAAMRRRPVQSRAYASSQALQEAFVRILTEEGFERATVREVTAVGRVGIGAVLRYFRHVEDVAAAGLPSPTE